MESIWNLLSKQARLSSFLFIAVIIGFTKTSYTVDEGIGNLEVDVRVFNVPDDQPLPASVDLVIQSVSGSASS